jgi:hypothetical protein
MMFLVSPPNDACACLVLPLLLFYSQHASPLSCANLGFMTKARVATKYSNNLNICQMLPSGKLQLMINTIFFSKKKNSILKYQCYLSQEVSHKNHDLIIMKHLV